MKPVKTLQKYKCDFCKKRSVKSAMEKHEKRCFRNPNRYCDYCDNQGYTLETVLDEYPPAKQDCPYCSTFSDKQLKEIEAREAKISMEK